MAADVIPRPAVKAAFLDVRDVIGRQVVPYSVALVRRAPKLSRSRIDRFAHSVANAIRIDFDEFSGRCVFEYIGAIGLCFVVADIRLGADTNVELLAVI